MYKNKIVNNYAKTYYYGAVIYTAIAIFTGGLLHKYSGIEKEPVVYEDGSVGYDNSLDALSVLLIMFCTIMVYYSAVAIPKSSNKYSNHIAKKYINQKIKENNTLLRDYQYLLQNEQALQHITSVLSQHFTNSEIKAITNIVKKFDKTSTKTKQQYRQALADMEKNILQIIKEHEQIDFDFTNKILVEMARASYNYPVKQNQNVK